MNALGLVKITIPEGYTCAQIFALLEEKGIIRDCKYGLKVLGNGTLTKKVTVKAAAFSGSAKEKIEEAGGKAEVV